MKILWLRWKDIKHPEAGGAEIVAYEIFKRSVQNGNEITTTSTLYPNAKHVDSIDGAVILRKGIMMPLHFISVMWWVLTTTKLDYDLIVEEVNTVPYFSWFLTRLRLKKIPHIYFYHQLCKQTWYWQIHPLLQNIGFLSEVIYTRILTLTNSQVITVSNSSKNDLVSYGFKDDNINIISEGLEAHPQIDKQKESKFTILYHGSLRAMKRPEDVIQAFYKTNLWKNGAQLWISGGGDQTTLRQLIESFELQNHVHFFGRVTEDEKLSLMMKSHVLCSTSVKEGWGLIVSEANSTGTPAIGYNVDGLRDSIRFGNGNLLSEPNPESLCESILELHNEWQHDITKYENRCKVVFESTKKLTYDQTYKDFVEIISQCNIL